jgi:hypothetical protein
VNKSNTKNMNKKSTVTIIALASALLVGLIFASVYVKTHQEGLVGGGSAINVSYYKTATNTTVVCSGATSTVLLAAATRQDSRNNFEITVASTTPITVCKTAIGCVIGSGATVTPIASSSAGKYVQTDAYYGAYSCIGNNGSSTVGVISAQS